MRCGAVQRDVAEHLANDRAELETVPAEAGADYDMLIVGMRVNDEVFVGRLRVETNAALAQGRVSDARYVRAHEGSNGSDIAGIGARG